MDEIAERIAEVTTVDGDYFEEHEKVPKIIAELAGVGAVLECVTRVVDGDWRESEPYVADLRDALAALDPPTNPDKDK